MKTKRHPGAGIEIWDVDLRVADDDTFARIRALFDEHGLLFFRGQELSEEDHIALARRFGTINVNRFFVAHADYPEIAMVAKAPEERFNIGGGWHTDHSYDVEPALGSVLVARELPATGGDTCFVSMYDAFATLPVRVQERLRGMNAVHSSKHVFGSKTALLRRLTGSQNQVKNPELADAMEDVVHPVVIKHPLSGREALYVNPGFTIRFEGRSLLRSLPLLGYLYAHATRARRVARFQWQPGSVAVWDNRATWHFAKNDYAGQRRVMHRITIDGCPLTAARSARA
ncbi:MAG: TauD/TfdA family dioxygenase [Sandaracinaceae bacterium]|nr:TauD/TfdA family dioxygenase [Sandaracinaceae bacterium]